MNKISPKQEDRENALIRFLRSRGVSSAKELLTHLEVSQPVLSKLVSQMKNRIEVLGRRRSTLYTAKRQIRDLENRIPVFRISERGECEPLGELISFYPSGFAWVSKNDHGLYEVFPGIPYFLSDCRPQGFLGRTFSRCNPDLKLPTRLIDWSEDDYAEALARRGEDCAGNLIVGRESFERYHKKILQPIEPIPERNKIKFYTAAAETALEGTIPGSSAAGEQPKFSAVVETVRGVEHVLVKFSPRFSLKMADFQGRRWADLLICESIALNILSEKGFLAAHSRIYEGGERVFLEVTRFDRVDLRGRVGLISLSSLDDEWFGQRDNWISASVRLLERGAITLEEAKQIRFLYSFGGLIANSDRHFGNLSFFWELGEKKIRLAPIYDMLPMLYAPVEGQRVEREFGVEHPKPDAVEEWNQALPLACKYWERVSHDQRISEEFRETAKKAERTLRPIAPR